MSNLTGINTLNETTLTGIDTLDLTVLNCETINNGELNTETITTNDILINQYAFLEGSVKANNLLISPTEISYLKNCESNIQNQINSLSSGGALAHLSYNSIDNAVVCDVNLKIEGNIINSELTNIDTELTNISNKITDITYTNNKTNIGTSSLNTLLIKSDIDDRGDGKSINAKKNISTDQDIYMNCYSNTWQGSRIYNYYKLYDFISEENTVSRNRIDYVETVANNAVNVGDHALNVANNAQNKANDAYDLANTAKNNAQTAQNKANDAYNLANTAKNNAQTAQDTADSALGLAGTNALAISGILDTVIPDAVAALEVQIGTLETQINTIDDEVLALDGKTQFQTANIETLTTNFSGTLSCTNLTVSYINGLPYSPFNPTSLINQI
jgi:hypothetical protein